MAGPPIAPLASVVVPAHQEGGTIARCLRALLGDARPGELEVVVAANGCSDGTADRAREEARRLGHDVVVLDLPEAGKAAALRAAEAWCTILPRLYVDADVECPTATVRALVAALADPGDDGAAADVAVPTRVLDLDGASRGARAYYRTWQDLPWVREQLAGRGVVALGARARATFEELPDVVADDRWLTTRVPRERAVVVAAPVVVRPPRRLADVLRVRRRVYRGNRAQEVAAHDAALGQRIAVVPGLLRSPASAAGTLLFLAVTLLAKLPSRDAGWGPEASPGGPERRRVLVVVQNLPLVLDRRVRTECRALLDAGYGVTVICPKATPDEPDVHDLDGVLVRSYPATGTTSGVASYVAEFVQCWLQTAVRSWRAWRHEGFDVIQACNPPDTYWALGLLWKVAGKRFVFDQHDLSPEVYEARFGRRGLLHGLLILLEAATYRTADHVISTNPEYQQVARERGRIPAERSSVVMSTPDVAMLRTEVEPSRRAGRRHLVCYVGIMGPQDGVGRLLAAVDHYVHVLGRDDAHFALLGFGDSLADLRRDATDRGLDAWVTFTGRVDHAELGRWLSTAAVGVTPDPVNEFNHRSTMNKTLEYMAHGVPVVATDLRETRRCAQDAAVYAADGDPIRLAELVAELLDDPLRRRRMGRLGRLRIERDLAWRHQAATYVSVFDRLLGVTRPPGRVPPPGRDVRNPAVGALPRATIDSTEPDRAPVTVGEH